MCLSVVLVYSFVSSCDCCIYIVKSRKDISVSEMPMVNLIVGCTIFKWFMNCKSEYNYMSALFGKEGYVVDASKNAMLLIQWCWK